MQAQDKQGEVNAVILQSLSHLQRQGPLWINHGQENGTNIKYGSRSHGGYRSDRDDIARDGRFLDTPNQGGDVQRYHSSSSSDRPYDRHRYHPYRRSARGYFPDEFKKYKPPNFDGDLKKLEDAEAWLLKMKNFFELHNYMDNMKAKVATFNLKYKAYI